MRDLLVGVDGGGTSTTVLIESVDGTYSQRVQLGAFNLNSIGEERFVMLLQELFEKVGQSGVCKSICFGAAGISNVRTKTLIMETAHAYVPESKITLMGDHEIALYGATNGGIGSIVIAGTGSIAAGMLDDGTIIRAGGYGHLIDDFGSGYSVAKDALLAIVRASDGRIEETLLTQYVMEKWNLTTIAELVKKVHEANDKSVIASISKEVDRAAKEGDEAAILIMRNNARSLLELVEAIYRSLGICGELPLSLMGGMLLGDTMLRKELLTQISQQAPAIVVTQPLMEPVGGALLVARRATE